MSRRPLPAWLIALALPLAATGRASAQTTTWQATASGNWSDAANWTGGVPGPALTAVFSTAGATQFATTNDLTALTIAALTVNNTAPQPFTIGGNAFTIGTAAGINMTTAAQNLTIDAGVTLGVTQTWAVGGGRVLTANGVIDGAGGLGVIGATNSSGTVRVTNANNSYAGNTTVVGATLEVVGPAGANMTLPATGNSALGTGTITVNGGELRLTPADTFAINGTDIRPVSFGPTGGRLSLGRTTNGRVFLTTTDGAAFTAVVRTTAFNSNNWGTTGGVVLNNATTSIQGTGPVRFEMQDGALTTFSLGAGGVWTINAPFTFQGVDNGSVAANRVAITAPGNVNDNPAARTVGRMGIASTAPAVTTLTFANGLVFRDAVQVTIMNNSQVIDGDITLATTSNGTFVAFQGRGTGTLGAFSTLTLGGATANARTLTISADATAVLDARFRQDSASIGGVVMNSRAVIQPGGTLQLSQSDLVSGTETGFHTLNGNVRGQGNDATDARFVVRLGNKSAGGGLVGGVDWTASTANLEVYGTGNGGLRVEGPSANLAAPFLSTARLQAVTGTGGTLTIAPSDNGTTIAAAPAAASPVRLGVGSSGTGPVTVTLGAAANDLQNWAGLVVKGSSGGGTTVATLAANQTFAQTTVTGGTLTVPAGVTLTSPVMLAGGALAGGGTVTAAVTVGPNGMVSPGTSPGQLTVGGMTWQPLGNYLFEYNAATPPGPAGAPPGPTDNDFITSAAGALSLGALSNTAGGRFNLQINTLLTTVPPATPVDYTIATFGAILGGTGPIPTGTDVSNLFTFNGSIVGSVPTVRVVGNSLVLNFVPVPEPAGVLALAAAAGGLLGWRRRGIGCG
jgi:hypothetical protein